ERVREPGNREAYNEALLNMEKLLRQLDNPSDIRVPYNQFVSLIREIENQTEDEAHYHLATVNRTMMAHAEMDKAIAARYASAAEGADERLLALHQQSLETNQILLLYQNNMFSSIGVYFMETSEGIFNTIDARITAQAATLRDLLPNLNPTLHDLERPYTFMPPRLIKHHHNWVPISPAFYLLHNTKSLDQMAL